MKRMLMELNLKSKMFGAYGHQTLKSKKFGAYSHQTWEDPNLP